MARTRVKRIFVVPMVALILLGSWLAWLTYATVQREKLTAPLLQALASGDSATAKDLILRGADANARDNPARKQRAFLDYIREALGRRQKAPEDTSPTALMYATASCDSEIARLLLERGADPNPKNAEGDTALIIAAQRNEDATTNLLLEHGAQINGQNAGGDTALMYSALYGNTDTVRWLLAKGANVSLKNREGETALLFAMDSDNTELIRLLLDKNPDVNVKDVFGDTPLIHAATNDDEIVARLLLAHDANIRAKNKAGETALRVALKMHHPDIIALLKQAGATK